jgi:hypothetical protein
MVTIENRCAGKAVPAKIARTTVASYGIVDSEIAGAYIKDRGVE